MIRYLRKRAGNLLENCQEFSGSSHECPGSSSETSLWFSDLLSPLVQVPSGWMDGFWPGLEFPRCGGFGICPYILDTLLFKK